MENKRKIIIVATILIIVLSLLLCACDDNSNNNSSQSGNGSSNHDYYNATNTQILKSAVTALKLPDYIYQRMLKTTAMQGRQEVTVNGITVSWTYHPDNGLEAMFTIA